MLKLVTYLGFGAVVFGMAAAGSVYLQKSQSGKQMISTSQNAGADRSLEGSTLKAPPPPHTHTKKKKLSHESSKGKALPVPVRPRPMSAEEVFRFGASIRTQRDILKKREQALEKDQSRLDLVFNDIRAEQRELESLQARVEGRIQAAESLLTKVIQERDKSTQERQDAQKNIEDFKKAQIEIEVLEVDNLKKLSLLIQSMEPEKAAGLLREFANDGNIAMAVKLLANFEEREATKILEAVDDPGLMAQLVEEFRLLKRPPTAKKKTRR